jgi:hypothetical protein
LTLINALVVRGPNARNVTPSSGGSSVIQATVGCQGYDCYMPFRMTAGPPG